MAIESVRPSNHLILCCPLLLLSSILPSIRSFLVNQLFPSHGQELELQLQLQQSPLIECSWLISYSIFCFGLLADEGALKSLLQHHNLKASILWCSASVAVVSICSCHHRKLVNFKNMGLLISLVVLFLFSFFLTSEFFFSVCVQMIMLL